MGSLFLLAVVGLVVALLFAFNAGGNHQTASLPLLAGSVFYDLDAIRTSDFEPALMDITSKFDIANSKVYCFAILRPESKRVYGVDAIRVEISGKTVGYISEEDTRDVQAALTELEQRGKPPLCRALITLKDENAQAPASFEVRLAFEWPLRRN